MNDKILLTAAGLQNPRIGQVFLDLLNKPVSQSKILFIPTAAICAESLRMLCKCIDELYGVGFQAKQLTIYDLDRKMSFEEIETYDVVYVAGGNTAHLVNKVNQVEFGPIIRGFVSRSGMYVGASAGSIMAAKIGMVNCRFTGMHVADGSLTGPIDLSDCPEIRLTDNQALVLDSRGSAIIE